MSLQYDNCKLKETNLRAIIYVDSKIYNKLVNLAEKNQTSAATENKQQFQWGEGGELRVED